LTPKRLTRGLLRVPRNLPVVYLSKKAPKRRKEIDRFKNGGKDRVREKRRRSGVGYRPVGGTRVLKIRYQTDAFLSSRDRKGKKGLTGKGGGGLCFSFLCWFNTLVNNLLSPQWVGAAGPQERKGGLRVAEVSRKGGKGFPGSRG